METHRGELGEELQSINVVVRQRRAGKQREDADDIAPGDERQAGERADALPRDPPGIGKPILIATQVADNEKVPRRGNTANLAGASGYAAESAINPVVGPATGWKPGTGRQIQAPLTVHQPHSRQDRLRLRKRFADDASQGVASVAFRRCQQSQANSGLHGARLRDFVVGVYCYENS